MHSPSLLYKRSVPINDKISIQIPLVESVLDDETNYYSTVHILTSMPIDMMVILDDMGVDFSTIDDYEMFLMLFPAIACRDTSLVFGDLDLTKFRPGVNSQNGQPALVDTENDIIIDRGIYMQISDTLRKIHHFEKNIKKPANAQAREFMLEIARKKAKRAKNKPAEAILEPLVVALVNTEQFKYDYESVGRMTIYQFNESLHQIITKVNYDNRMVGVYTGNIDSKELTQDDWDWLKHK